MAKNKGHELISNLSADCVIFGFDLDQLNVLLINRGKSKTEDREIYALPGDLIREEENLDHAANRILEELTGLSNIYMEQVGAFGDPNRISKESDKAWLKEIREEPDARVITVGYYSLVNMLEYAPRPASFAQTAEWVSVHEIPDLAFDHNEILSSSLDKLKEKIRTQPIGFNLLDEKFTLSQLQKLYEAILDKDLDKRNFRRKIINLNILSRLDEKQKGVPHKPSYLYRFNEEKYNELIKTGFDNFGF